jgi:polar amino acid transport system permease protein
MTLDFLQVLRPPYLTWLLEGIWVTASLFCVAWLISFVLALIIVLLRMAPVPGVRWIAASYVEVARNIPLLVQVMFWYFAMPMLLPDVAQEWLNHWNSEFVLAALALGCCIGAYVSEALMSGIRAIPRAQLETGRALGFSFMLSMRYIVLPQAFRATVPPLLNSTLLLFKNTSIAMAIGVHELMYQTRAIENDTFRTFEIFAVATFIYLLGSTLLMIAGSHFEKIAKRNQRGQNV